MRTLHRVQRRALGVLHRIHDSGDRIAAEDLLDLAEPLVVSDADSWTDDRSELLGALVECLAQRLVETNSLLVVQQLPWLVVASKERLDHVDVVASATIDNDDQLKRDVSSTLDGAGCIVEQVEVTELERDDDVEQLTGPVVCRLRGQWFCAHTFVSRRQRSVGPLASLSEQDQTEQSHRGCSLGTAPGPCPLELRVPSECPAFWLILSSWS